MGTAPRVTCPRPWAHLTCGGAGVGTAGLQEVSSPDWAVRTPQGGFLETHIYFLRTLHSFPMQLLALDSVLLLCALGGQSPETVTVGRQDMLVSQMSLTEPSQGPSTDARLALALVQSVKV